MTEKGNTFTQEPDDDVEDVAPVSGGTFTQSQVNAIVAERLARQKSRLLSSSDKAKADAVTLAEQLEKANARLAKYDEQSKKVLDERRKGLPESVTKLLDKLEPDEQLAWIEENGASIAAPEKPQSSGPEAPKPNPNTDRPKIDANSKVSESGIYYGV